jgi:hypothetical protein
MVASVGSTEAQSGSELGENNFEGLLALGRPVVNDGTAKRVIRIMRRKRGYNETLAGG